MCSQGAVGVEFAGKIQTHYAGTPVTLIHSRDQLLSNEPLPEEFKLKALKLLQQEGVKVILNQRVKVEEPPDGTHYVRFNDGGRLHTAMVIMATASSTPASQFLPCSVLSNTGTVNVDSKYVPTSSSYKEGRWCQYLQSQSQRRTRYHGPSLCSRRYYKSPRYQARRNRNGDGKCSWG